MLTILICKTIAFLGRLLGRGSSLPGAIALRLHPRILQKIKLPETVIAVTGSNGKTSTTELIRAAAEATGKRVICNSEGSNQIEGVATLLLRYCSLRGRVKADIVLLESDERFCQHSFSHFAPTHIVVTNLYRDQTTRNGSAEFVAGELKKGLPPQSILILNADDPLTAAFGATRDNCLYFGVEAETLREPADTYHAYDDGGFCPLCRERMRYTSHMVSHLGDYCCTVCGFARPRPTHAVTALRDGEFLLDGEQPIKPQLANIAFAYNIVAAYTVAVEALGLAPEMAAEALRGHTLSNNFIDRVSEFQIGTHKGLFLLSKHENSMAYNGSIETILAQGGGEITVVLIVDLLSRKYIANDMSWLWEIDFERLADDRIKRVVVGGRFADDVATRLLIAGIPADRLTALHDLDDMMTALRAQAVGDLFLLTCFTDIGKFQKRLGEDERA